MDSSAPSMSDGGRMTLSPLKVDEAEGRRVNASKQTDPVAGSRPEVLVETVLNVQVLRRADDRRKIFKRHDVTAGRRRLYCQSEVHGHRHRPEYGRQRVNLYSCKRFSL